jgi:hypothetical protein
MPLEVERLRRKAKEAREFAASCSNLQLKAQWLQSAEMWTSLADERAATLREQEKYRRK